MNNEFKEYLLEDLLVDIQAGFARKPTESGDVIHLRTNNISPEGTLDLSELKHISASRKEIEKYSLKKGDVLFNNTNSDVWVGKTAYVDRPLIFLFSNHLTRLRVDKTKVDPQYLAIYLHKLQREGYFKFISTRWVNQTAVNTTSLRRLLMKIPSMEIQRSTVAIINQASILKQRREQANQITNKLLQTVFRQMFGDLAKNPKNWKIGELEEVCDEVVVSFVGTVSTSFRNEGVFSS
jgi:type I restriction enzyme S subunit